MKKKVIIAVTNDLVADKRVNKVAESLIKFGYEPLVVGRKLKNSLAVNFKYKTKRFKLLFTKGALFYAEFNIRLFFFLLFKKTNIILSNDLDTLLACFFASKIKAKKLVYDSHEYFTEVPELQNNKKVQKIWLAIEKLTLPKVKNCYTVCKSIADIYNKKYGIDMKVVRNIPECDIQNIQKNIKFLNIHQDKKKIIYQGAVNIGRGLEYFIEAMQFIDNAIFIIIGDGDIKENLEILVSEKKLCKKVIFVGKIPFSELYSYTSQADLGISIEENIGLNYYYALPNKLFDYIRAEIPILASQLPEIQNIVETYNIGIFIEKHEPKHIAEKISEILNSDINLWKKNLKKASQELCWENEEKILAQIFRS